MTYSPLSRCYWCERTGCDLRLLNDPRCSCPEQSISAPVAQASHTQTFPCALCGGPLTVLDNINSGLIGVNVDGHAKAAHRTCPSPTATTPDEPASSLPDAKGQEP